MDDDEEFYLDIEDDDDDDDDDIVGTGLLSLRRNGTVNEDSCVIKR